MPNQTVLVCKHLWKEYEEYFGDKTKQCERCHVFWNPNTDQGDPEVMDHVESNPGRWFITKEEPVVEIATIKKVTTSDEYECNCTFAHARH